jgi:hypothetical protein
MMQESSTMTHRYALAAVLLAALSLPAAAQQTTQPDTSKKATPADTASKAGVSGTTTSTSNGSIAEPAKPSQSTTNPGASVTAPAPTTPSATMTPSPATPSAGASVTAPAPSGSSVTAPAPSGASSMSPSGANASTGIGASASSGATGQVQPTSGAVKVDVKVAPTLANTVKISADSAFALAKASPDAGEISSAELEMKDKALVYNIKMVKGAGASVVHVDAMTGEVVKDKKYGGLKASAENDKGLKKLEDAKEDSTKAAKP